jgi:hypothetical protein
MISRRGFHLFLGSVIALLLNSCIDVREEYWIHQDGSALAELSYEIPTSAARSSGGSAGLQQKVDQLLRDCKEVHRFSTQLSTEGDRTRIMIHAEIKNLRDLEGLTKNESLKNASSNLKYLAGEVSANIQGLSILIKRRISIPDALPALRYIPEEQLQGHRMVYILHLPQAATSSNATDRWNDGKSLIWDIPLTQAIRKPFTTEFKTALPIPWRLFVGVAAGLGILIASLFRLRRRWNRKRPTHQ